MHFLDALIALNDRLPARTRVYLRELVQQEIVQRLVQNHLQRPSRLVQTVDQIVSDPWQKLFSQHLSHDILLPPPNVQTVLLVAYYKTVIVHEAVH